MSIPIFFTFATIVTVDNNKNNGECSMKKINRNHKDSVFVDCLQMTFMQKKILLAFIMRYIKQILIQKQQK